MRVGVVGAGVTGLVVAYRLSQQGHACDVYERWPGLGGQAATLDVGDGALLERYYHHVFKSDRHILALLDELGMLDQIEWRPSSVAIFAKGRLHAFSSPLDILRFEPLTRRSRIRMGLAVLDLQLRHKRVEPFEDLRARDWVRRRMGREVWETVWGPLLHAKFSDAAEDLSMAWLWSKFTVRRQIKGEQTRTEMLGYPRDSFEPLFVRLRDEIEGRGGRVLIDRPAGRIARETGGFVVSAGAPDSFRRGHDPRKFVVLGDPERYDIVVATVPNRVFLQLLDHSLAEELEPDYAERLRSIEYHEALCMLLELDREFSRFYWSNMADPELPFIGLIEHTNFTGPEHYGGRHFLYVANYKPPGHPLLELDPDALLDTYEPGLRKVNPGFRRDWIKRRWLFREPDAQPIVRVGYGRRLPAIETNAPGLFLANTSQVYPEDRGTNYAVRLGDQTAAAVERHVRTGTIAA